MFGRFYLEADRYSNEISQYKDLVSSQNVGANPCGRPDGQVQDLSLPQIIEKIQDLFRALNTVKTFTDGGYEVRIYCVNER